MCPKTRTLIASAMLLAAMSAPGGAEGQTIALTPSLTLEERYDSNVNYRDDRESVDDDYVTTASPQINLLRERQRSRITAFYRLEARYYGRNPELNYLSHRAALDAGYDYSKGLRFSLSDSFTYTKDSLQAVSTGILTERTDIYANTLNLSARKKVTELTDFTLGLSDTILDFKDPSLIDTRTDSAALTLGHQYSPEGRSLFTYKFTNFHFDTLDGEKDIESHSLTLGIDEEIAPTVSVLLSGGVVYTPGLDGNYFAVAEAEFTKYMKDTIISAGYRREQTNPTGLIDEIIIHDNVGFTLEHQWDNSVNLIVYGNLSRNSSEPSGRLDLSSIETGASAAWLPYRWMSVGAGVSLFQQWDDDDIGRGVKRNQIFINLTLTGGEWRL